MHKAASISDFITHNNLTHTLSQLAQQVHTSFQPHTQNNFHEMHYEYIYITQPCTTSISLIKTYKLHASFIIQQTTLKQISYRLVSLYSRLL